MSEQSLITLLRARTAGSICNQDGTYTVGNCAPDALCQEAADEIDRLRADAERYRFLRDDFSPMGLNIDGNHSWAYRRNFSLIGPNLDEAIDKARAA